MSTTAKSAPTKNRTKVCGHFLEKYSFFKTTSTFGPLTFVRYKDQSLLPSSFISTYLLVWIGFHQLPNATKIISFPMNLGARNERNYNTT